jgi:hypothetical protein
MSTPQSALAYAPRGVGLAYAIVYIKKELDIYGWWIGARGADMHSAYFRLEDFYTTTGTTFHASAGSDLSGGWQVDLTSGRPQEIDPVAVESGLVQELERVRDTFAAEWLTFESDRDCAREGQAYREAELAHGTVNIRFKKLNKLDKQGALWRYYSQDFESVVGDYLGLRWPLDYGKG